jgi:hypothetical protein
MDNNRQNGYERRIGCCKHMWNTRVVSPMKVSKKIHGNKMIVANVIGTT